MAEPQIILCAGDRVRVRAAASTDEWCEASVLFASDNGKSVALSLMGMVRGGKGLYLGGTLPLYVDYEREIIMDLAGNHFDLEVAPG